MYQRCVLPPTMLMSTVVAELTVPELIAAFQSVVLIENDLLPGC
jgi:hypothetical protein